MVCLSALFLAVKNFSHFPSVIFTFRHVGYKADSYLPPQRGFKRGLYSHEGPQYYSRGFSRSVSKIDSFYGEPSADVKQRRKQYLGINYKIQIHDTYEINGYNENPTLVGDESYNEDLYTEDIKSFIAGQGGSKPIFIYYSQWTPHANLVQPPIYRPDGSRMNYTACFDAFPDRKDRLCSLDNDTRCVFCKQGMFVQVIAQKITSNGADNKNTYI